MFHIRKKSYLTNFVFQMYNVYSKNDARESFIFKTYYAFSHDCKL